MDPKATLNKIKAWFSKEPNLPKIENVPIESYSLQKRKLLSTTGRVLALISGFAIFFISLFEIIPFITFCYFRVTSFQFNNNPYVFQTLTVGVVGISCFAVNLQAGSFAAKRERFRFSVAVPILLLFAGVLTMLFIELTEPTSLMSYMQFGLPVTTLLVVSVVFIVASRKEFVQAEATRTVN